MTAGKKLISNFLRIGRANVSIIFFGILNSMQEASSITRMYAAFTAYFHQGFGLDSY